MSHILDKETTAEITRRHNEGDARATFQLGHRALHGVDVVKGSADSVKETADDSKIDFKTGRALIEEAAAKGVYAAERWESKFAEIDALAAKLGVSPERAWKINLAEIRATYT